MNRTTIEWIVNPDGSRPGWSWSPITGCLNHVNGLCKGGGFPCYAYKLANTRLKQRYLGNANTAPLYKDSSGKEWFADGTFIDPFYPRFWEERLNDGIFNLGRKPKGIFVSDMGDLFGLGVPEDWTRHILAVCKMSCYQQHRFYLLTKQPQNLIKFTPFPENAWVGMTITNRAMIDGALRMFEPIGATIKFLSIEPLLLWSPPKVNFLPGIQWLIIGACTGTQAEMTELVRKYPVLTVVPFGNKWTAQPRIEWVREIVEAADKAGVKVFLKNNLEPLLVTQKDNNKYAPLWANGGYGTLRQEMPE